ncbi:flagellar hook assembly protein FlgD [Paenibacillus sp. 598K]|uniref:flagellar hook capping FlgD N-terminal domain-containing protein n=1 Tax=Paenibacillus sp. 598K TaxID=1117987 RepID=UPI000FF9A9ED|nr:flagellar hook capping FlgD N-terminal domain-containing protein [Paenibacillus sp. 598K]GBF72003.1 flagellar hook assembly protein FlgD [Paenibacillus sp. 598K]
MADIQGTKNIWPIYSKNNVSLTKPKDDTLGKDDFLKILITQLKYQDPMQPMQDRDFIAQMAQFSSVEQMMNMAKEMTYLRHNMGTASSMIGKTIEWSEIAETGQSVRYTGEVSAIVMKEGIQYAQVGDWFVPVEEIETITVASSSSSEGVEPDA